MTTLTEAAYYARNIIKYGGVGLIALIVGQWGISSAIRAYNLAHPPYYPPTMTYGKLPQIVFPEKTNSSVSFSLQLPNDGFPKMSDQAKVYLVYQPVDSLLALEDGTKTAKSLGFDGQPTETKTGVYQWTNGVTNQTLTINVLDGSFHIKYPYENDQLLQNPDVMPTNSAAIAMAQSFLQQANKLAPDLKDGEAKVSYYKISYTGLKPAASLSESNIIKVDIFRKATDDGIKILPSDPTSASVSFLISGSTVESKKIVEVNYSYAPIDRQSYSTYPIKTPQQAWSEVQSGNYWTAEAAAGNSTVIRKIYIAYFEPATLTNYMQPIYVFEGDGNFVGYVPAVNSSEILQK